MPTETKTKRPSKRPEMIESVMADLEMKATRTGLVALTMHGITRTMKPAEARSQLEKAREGLAWFMTELERVIAKAERTASATKPRRSRARAA